VSSDADRAVAAPDAESAQVAEWLARHGRVTSAVEPLAGDVSTRRYYRVRLVGETTSHIVARYPPELAAAQRRFAAAAELLAAAGVRVPAIRLDDPDAGFACVEDLGPATLHERFATWEAAAGELDAALAAADAIRRLDRERVVALGSPPLDAALLRRELAQTVELLLAPRDLASPPVERALDALCDELAAPPLVPVAPAGVAVLDFQDLRLGPQGYDLASLLNDSLFASDEVEARVLAAWPQLAGGREPYRLAVAQRSLKAVGTYLAFARRGKRRHLPLVEPTLERALGQLARLRCTAALGETLWTRIRAAGRDAALC
jgi:hypothetical protein